MAKYCGSCGTQMDDSANVCPNCGTPVAGAQPVNPGQPAPAGVQGKSKTVAGILAILLGAFGVHNFYLGYTGKAVAQLCISVLSCFFLAIVSEIWGIVEGVQILTGTIKTDANGVPLVD